MKLKMIKQRAINQGSTPPLIHKISSILEQLYTDLHKYTISFELTIKIFRKLLEMT